MKKYAIIILCLTLAAFLSGCVYYNTFYNAKKSFNEAENKRNKLRRSGSKNVNAGLYKKAIEKSQLVLDKYPTSKYYDDALYVNGVSHFWAKNYVKAEKRFRELIANFPESEFFKESRLYLAKSKLNLDEIRDAMSVFEELFSEGHEKWIKAEAAIALGEYYVEQNDYKKAEEYFGSLVDSLGSDEEKTMAQMYIADGLFKRFRYNLAFDDYQEILKSDISTDEEYLALYRSGECLYFMNDLEGGKEYFEKLAGNDIYFDSLPAVKLMIAQGYEWDGDLELAQDVYEEVAIESPRSVHGSYANYMLGLIYQIDYEDYPTAKDHFDKAKAAGRNSDVFEDALERSANIGKLEEYLKAAHEDFDSTATLDEINRAAETQFYLSELYLTKMDKPDSALEEFHFILDNFQHSYLAPKANIAVAAMMRDYYGDTLAFDSLLDFVLSEYPHSDYIPDALELKGLLGTDADTGYAMIYYKRAENFLFSDTNFDSAYYYISYVADSFPQSYLYDQANFTRLWMIEEYKTPGDSTLYYDYLAFTDSFPGSEFTDIVNKKLVIKRKKRRNFEEEIFDDSLYIDSTEYAEGDVIDDRFDDLDPANRPATTMEERCERGPDGETILEIGAPPTKFDHEFRYPPSAYSLEFEGYLCFQVKIDPFGYAEDIRLVTPTGSDDLDIEATQTIESAQFPTYWIRPEYADQWFLYKYLIQLPQSLR